MAGKDTLTDAELDDIQRDAESTARLVGAPGSPVRQRASATVRLVAEVRRLRSLCTDVSYEVEAIIDAHVCTGVDACTCSGIREATVVRLRAAGGES